VATPDAAPGAESRQFPDVRSLPGAMARRELIRVRLARRELEALDRLAMARGGLTRSELVREADPAPRPAPTLAELLKPFAEPPLSGGRPLS